MCYYYYYYYYYFYHYYYYYYYYYYYNYYYYYDYYYYDYCTTTTSILPMRRPMCFHSPPRATGRDIVCGVLLHYCILRTVLKDNVRLAHWTTQRKSGLHLRPSIFRAETPT